MQAHDARQPGPRGRNIVGLLWGRQTLRRGASLRRAQLSWYGETVATKRFQLRECELPAHTKSTISVSFSTCGERFASTHGDHTVKVSCPATGRVVQTLSGHPRTPWTVKFHPLRRDIVASGCLGQEVRVWDTETGHCLYQTTLDCPIISVCFHPAGDHLAIACGAVLYLWDYQNDRVPYALYQGRNTLRCAAFPPCGNLLIIGEENDMRHLGIRRHAQPGRPEITVQLRLWRFDLGGDSDRVAAAETRVGVER